MNNLLKLTACAVFLMANPLFAQGTDEQALVETLEGMRQAQLSANVEQLEALIAPSLTYGHTNGYIEDNKAFIAATASGDARYNVLEWSNQTLDIDGDMAVVRNRMISEYLNKGVPGKADIGVIMVWKKGQDTGWKLHARQAYTRLP